MTDLKTYIKTSLFNEPYYVSLPNEIVVDDIPIYIKITYNKYAKSICFILYNLNVIRMCEIDEDIEYNLLPDYNVFLRSSDDPDVNTGLILDHLRDLLGHLQFDGYNGKFIKDTDITNNTLNNDMIELFKDLSNVKMKLPLHEKCCVCLENTLTKTNCKHYLCIRCAVHLHSSKVTSESEYQEREILCPCCRCELIY
jgi:ribosomal protein S26